MHVPEQYDETYGTKYVGVLVRSPEKCEKTGVDKTESTKPLKQDESQREVSN